MEYRIDIAEIITRNDTANKIFFICIIRNIKVNKVSEFSPVFQIIND